MKVINKWDEIPKMEEEKEEVNFWEKNALSSELIHDSRHIISEKDSTMITMRVDVKMLSRIKRIARMRYLNYQSMLKQWIAERLESEIKSTE